MTFQSEEYYVRDISGKEIAIYSGSSLTQWNIWGLDNVGKINADTTRNYYLKDHLGSIRVVLNSSNAVVSAQDYDAWGYPLENRTYQNSVNRYKFISSELDFESNYTHFGLRQFDSRIGRFLSTEPIVSGSFGWSSFVYAGDNPLILIDPSGTEWFYSYENEGWEYSEQKWKTMWTGKSDEKGNKIYEYIQGFEELLYFSGSELQWLAKDGNKEVWQAVSGRLKDGKTQPSKQSEKDYGPIPEGWWQVNPSETYSMEKDVTSGKLWEVYKWVKESGSWGYFKTPLGSIGETETYGRTEMYIHGGDTPGSIGCIDLTGSNSAFHERFLDYNRVMLLHVDYSKLKK